MKRPNASLIVQGVHVRTVRFTCDQEIDLEKFQQVVADISKYQGGYPTLEILPKKGTGPTVQTQDCRVKAGVILDWETWVEIGDVLYRRLSINVTL